MVVVRSSALAVELASGARRLVGVGLDGGHAMAAAGEYERAVAAPGADVEHGGVRRDGRGEGHELAADDVVGVRPKQTALAGAGWAPRVRHRGAGW